MLEVVEVVRGLLAEGVGCGRVPRRRAAAHPPRHRRRGAVPQRDRHRCASVRRPSRPTSACPSRRPTSAPSSPTCCSTALPTRAPDGDRHDSLDPHRLPRGRSRWSPPPAAANRDDNGRIHASGHVEATEVRLAAKVGGRLLEAPLEEGDTVRAGDLVAPLRHRRRRAPARPGAGPGRRRRCPAAAAARRHPGRGPAPRRGPARSGPGRARRRPSRPRPARGPRRPRHRDREGARRRPHPSRRRGARGGRDRAPSSTS